MVKDQLLARPNTDLAVISGGLTAVLQPLNKCIDKLFKTKVRPEYQASMVKGPCTYMAPRKKNDYRQRNGCHSGLTKYVKRFLQH